MTILRRAPRWLAVLVVALSTFASAVAFAGPRSGGSFSGRQSFRSGGGYSAPGYSGGGYRSSPYSGGYGYGGGSHFFFLPGFGGYGYGGGFGLFGSLAAMLVVGLVVSSIVRAVRASRYGGGRPATYGGYDEGEVEVVQHGRSVARLRSGELFGEMSLLGDSPTNAEVRTLVPTSVLFLGRDYFRRLISALPALRKYFEDLYRSRAKANA